VSDAVAWSHYLPLPGVIEHKRRRPVDRHQRRLARYGGEEFIAALPAPDAAQALGLGERLRAAVEAAACPPQRPM